MKRLSFLIVTLISAIVVSCTDTPENPMPDFETELFMPSFFLPVVLEEGETEVFIGENVQIKKGELSSRFYALQKELLFEQITANGLADAESGQYLQEVQRQEFQPCKHQLGRQPGGNQGCHKEVRYDLDTAYV